MNNNQTNQAAAAAAECTWIGPDTEYPRLQPTCCRAVVPGRSYCEQHLWLVYQQGTALRRRVRDTRVADSVHTLESLINEAVEELIDEGFL